MLNKQLFLYTFITFCMQSFLCAAAGSSSDISRPGDRRHQNLCHAIEVPEDRTIAKISSQSFFSKIDNESELLTYLQERGTSGEAQPHELIVMPKPVSFGKKYVQTDEPVVLWERSPLCAALHNSTRRSYIEAAYAIAQKFPAMITKNALEDSFFESLPASAALSEMRRTFFDLFVPMLTNSDICPIASLVEAKEPQYMVALYARGARFEQITSTSKLKISKKQLATLEVLARKDDTLKASLQTLSEENMRGHRVDTEEPADDLANNVVLWLAQEREHLRRHKLVVIR